MPSGETIPLGEGPADPDPISVEADGTPLPVIDWEGRAVRVAYWEPGAAWERVERLGWVPLDGVPTDFGAIISRAELLELLRRSLDASPDELRSMRVLTLLGRLSSGESIGSDQIEAVERVLPGAVDSTIWQEEPLLADRLGRLNDEWKADAAWSGIEYRAVTLDDLPGY
jgi:hypothetical protein